jgi:regulator of RNase E activity RraB
MTHVMKWPDDADGDVLRILEEKGFDFEKEIKIDFEIEFDHWPLSKNEIGAITRFYPGCELNDPDEEDIAEGILTGTVNLQVTSKVTYEFIVNTQEEITKKVKQYGGWCESWGVLL